MNYNRHAIAAMYIYPTRLNQLRRWHGGREISATDIMQKLVDHGLAEAAGVDKRDGKLFEIYMRTAAPIKDVEVLMAGWTRLEWIDEGCPVTLSERVPVWLGAAAVIAVVSWLVIQGGV